MIDFDAVAPRFDVHRELPGGVARLARDALWQATQSDSGRLVLEIGAGTGRVGHAFHAAGDAYVGVDLSRGMLNQFVARVRANGGETPQLALCDGRALPFGAGTFDAVLMVQVLSGVRCWRQVLDEARRVLRPMGTLALGRTVPPDAGVDRRMRDQLTAILADLGSPGVRPGATVSRAVCWLAPRAFRHIHVVAATWEQSRTPREFFLRHRTGARFAALPREMRAIALARLEDWACATFDTLDAITIERWAFELDIFMF